MTDEEAINEQIKNGGSAFPSKMKLAEGSILTQYGMSLRDYIAVNSWDKAYELALKLAMNNKISSDDVDDLAAKMAYEFADAMIKVRSGEK